MVGTRHILGLAIDDCGIVATELSVRAGRTEMRATGEFPWEKELTSENTKELGQGLRHFLREHGFTARRVVVGLAAKWVLAKEIEAPPAAPEALSGILGIQAERVFSMNTDELVFDYCGRTSTSEKSQVLLLAARRQTVAQIKELTEAAGLHVQSITVSAFACGCAPSKNGSAGGYGLYTRPTYCEFWGQSDGSPRFIKHIPLEVNGSPSGYADVLTTTIQRQVLLSLRQDQTPPHHVTAYDACGLSDETFNQLNKRLAPQISLSNGRAGVLSASPGHPQQSGSVAAAAVALAAVRPERLTVDFLNPRIGEKKAVSHKRIVVWAAVTAAVLLIALGVFLAGWQSDRREIATYKEQLSGMSEDLAAATDVVARLTYAESWLSTEPRFLNCLRGLTLAFPEEGTVWATSLAMNESGSGSVVGKASSPESVQEVVDKIRADQAFADVKTIHIQDAGRGAREKEFAISFLFKGAK